jgi:hypothetical protein
MTSEERFQKIEENLLVQSHLVAAFERETKVRLEAVEAQVDRHEQAMAEFRVVVARALDALERFIAGQPGADGARP